MIDPNNKQINVFKMVGGVTWDGYTYAPSNKYNYKTTSLCILGSKICFKEDLENVDISSLQLLYNGNKCIVYTDNKAIYKQYHHNTHVEKINLTDYMHVDGFLYKDSNDSLYVIPYMTSTFRLEKIQGLPGLNITSLKHIAGNYYTDKNGLYYLGYHDEYKKTNSQLIRQSVKLEDSNGKLIKPIVYPRYFIYDKSVYAVNENAEFVKLELKSGEIKEHTLNEYNGHYVITDGNNTYYSIKRYMGYSTSERFNDETIENFIDSFYWKDVDKWNIINNSIFNYMEGDNYTFYFPSVDKPFVGQHYYYTVVHSPKGYYAFNPFYGKRLKKISKLYIRNYETKKYEELDIKQYHYINFDMYVYKNRLYTFGSRPVKELVNDVNKLEFIKQNNGYNSNYITDGDCLIYAGEGSGYTIDKSDGDERIIYGEKRNLIKYDINIHNLIAINKDMLYDGKYIINHGMNGIEVIPIHELGLDIKILVN